jgi:VanZ family protein
MRMPPAGPFLRLAQFVFATAAVVVFLGAVAPLEEGPPFLNIPWDKAVHFIAFYGLAGLGAAALPWRSYRVLGAALSAYGALIEIVQGLPIVNRDCQFSDWVADTIAILAAYGPLALRRWREWTLPAPRGAEASKTEISRTDS